MRTSGLQVVSVHEVDGRLLAGSLAHPSVKPPRSSSWWTPTIRDDCPAVHSVFTEATLGFHAVLPSKTPAHIVCVCPFVGRCLPICEDFYLQCEGSPDSSSEPRAVFDACLLAAALAVRLHPTNVSQVTPSLTLRVGGLCETKTAEQKPLRRRRLPTEKTPPNVSIKKKKHVA